jgi:tripartite-type tricarboxylate transporter receptor subunit TctC
VATVSIGLLASANDSFAAAPFYQGKTVRVTVGFSAGGGFDLWARVVARHIGKNIPGNPTVIVENVTGAGGLIQTNQLFKGTKPDGLTIGHINGGLILGQMLGQPGYVPRTRRTMYLPSARGVASPRPTSGRPRRRPSKSAALCPAISLTTVTA